MHSIEFQQDMWNTLRDTQLHIIKLFGSHVLSTQKIFKMKISAGNSYVLPPWTL